MRSQSATSIALLGLGVIVNRVAAADVLKTTGFSTCSTNATIKANRMEIQYDKDTKVVTFDVSGTSTRVQNVTASLVVTAYGQEVYQRDFDPCDESTKVDQLCPVPSGTFSAKGNQSIPDEYADMIPSIAFSIPDLDGVAKLELKAKDSGEQLACIQSTVGNGKSIDVPAVSYLSAGVAGVALVASAFSAAATAGSPGATASSPSFSELVWWFQGIAMNGMMSVEYPSVYRQFTKNFGFAAGIIPWSSMQRTIDNFRAATGGNLTNESYDALQNTTLVFSDGSTANVSKRAVDLGFNAFHPLFIRAVETNVNDTDSSSSNSSISNNKLVTNAQAYFEELSVPSANVFMTVLLIFAIVVAAIAAGILLFKVILETWALFGNFPKSLTSFRKNYWFILARTITSLIMLLYGVWTLYCVFQFTHGDSWAAKVLAGVTLAAFTGILGFYAWRIWRVVKQYRKVEGDNSGLYNDKSTWTKYRIFYENFRTGYWWFFLPVIVYMFAKGCIIAAGDGHGLVQSAGQLIVEALMLVLLLWSRPYNTTSGKWINLVVQVVRVLSVVCILVFVEELGISQTTKTITGVVLIAVQAGLTGILAILIAVNAIITCVRQNPHRKRRKEAEKLRDIDNLTPLDARDSLLMQPTSYKNKPIGFSEFNQAPSPYEPLRTEKSRGRDESSEGLISSGAAMGYDRSHSRGSEGSYPRQENFRQPRLPYV